MDVIHRDGGDRGFSVASPALNAPAFRLHSLHRKYRKDPLRYLR
jgi:hypothetical protein